MEIKEKNYEELTESCKLAFNMVDDVLIKMNKTNRRDIIKVLVGKYL